MCRLRDQSEAEKQGSKKPHRLQKIMKEKGSDCETGELYEKVRKGRRWGRLKPGLKTPGQKDERSKKRRAGSFPGEKGSKKKQPGRKKKERQERPIVEERRSISRSKTPAERGGKSSGERSPVQTTDGKKRGSQHSKNREMDQSLRGTRK